MEQKNEKLPLPPKWVKCNSDRGTYYWNKETNTTQWKFPKEQAIAFSKLQTIHGYINFPERDGDRESKTVSDLKENGRTPQKQRPHRNTGKSGARRSVKQVQSMDTCSNHSPVMPKKEEQFNSKLLLQTTEDLETESVPSIPPPLPPPPLSRQSDKFNSKPSTSNDYDEVHSPSPPPVPERNYGEDDVIGINSSEKTRLAEMMVPDSPDDSSPPPIPVRTELSTQLVSPPLRDHFIYKSDLSDLSRIGTDDRSTRAISPTLAAADKEKLSFTTDTRVHVDDDSLDEPEKSLVYDEIVEPSLRGRRDVVSRSQKPLQNPNGAIYDEIPIEGRLNHTPVTTTTSTTATTPLLYEDINKRSLNFQVTRTAIAPSKKQYKADSSPHPSPGDRPPMELPPESSRQSPSATRHFMVNSHPPPSVSPPPTPSSVCDTSSREPSPLPPCLAYEVVPLHLTIPTKPTTKQAETSGSDDNDEIFMTVNHEHQRQRFNKFSGSLQNSKTPPVPPRRRRGSESFMNSRVHHSSNPSLDSDDNGMYDKLNHIRALKSLGATLPRTDGTRDLNAEYSTLNFAQQRVLMRAGVKVHGSLMNSSTPDVTDVNRPSSQESGDARSEEGDIQLIHAPNVPTPDVQRQPHLYEDVNEENAERRGSREMYRRNSDSVLNSGKAQLVYARNVSSSAVKPKPHEINREDTSRQSHNAETSKDLASNDGDVPLVFAPNVPSPNVQRKPRLYEEVDQEEEESRCGTQDTPSLVWDDDLIVSGKQGTGGGFSGSKRRHNLTAESKLQKPLSVSVEDYQKRLDRLNNHFYPELEIPEWPNQDPMLSPKQASDINKVVRESWQPKDSSDQDHLPDGWTKELNEQGQEFYWHIPTGKIQYVRPDTGASLRNSKSKSPSDADSLRSPTAPLTTFAAEYWGSCEVEEEKLVKGKSVQVVLACMRDILDQDPPPADLVLFAGLERRSSVYIQISGMELRWVRAEDNVVLTTQIINRIRVWGVGQESEREFGYISRNPLTNKHVCHVFVCDIAAIGIAQAMLDSHGQTVKDRVSGMSRRSSMADDLSASDIGNNETHGGTVLVQVPLAAAHRERSVTNAQQSPEKEEKVPEEQYKRLEATYIGFSDVLGPHGINVLNEAVQQLSIAKSRWLPVYVDIATSHIRILDKKSEKVLKEHRVRFLSFLGIASDDRYCGYVVDNGDNQFLFHGFQCLPNADKLCLALHSACQARYQRVIDAHLTEGDIGNIDSPTPKAHKKSLLSRIGSWKMKPKESEDESTKFGPQSFIVQFLGWEQIPKPTGVESVTTPLRKYSKKTSGVHLVEFIVSTAGFTINDPQKKEFASKHIPAKKITYCAKIRCHFVFICKESGKYYCYMFTESEVDLCCITKAIGELIT